MMIHMGCAGRLPFPQLRRQVFIKIRDASGYVYIL